MRVKRKIIALFLGLPVLLSLTLPGEEMTLSLEGCVNKALNNNLKIAIERYSPRLAGTNLRQAREMYMPRFDLNYGSQQTESPSYWWLQGEETQTSQYSDFSLSVLQQIPLGGSFSLSLSNYISDTNQSFQLINPRYGSTLRLDFVQPLLKDFGKRISQKEILIARNNLDISQNQLRNVVLDTVYRVEEAYWNLVYAIENHQVREGSLHLARDLLDKNRKEVEVGKLAPIEILNAETVVAQREADILQAEALIRSSQDVLQSILNLSGEGNFSAKIVPGDRPEFVRKSVSLENALATALSLRPDLKIRKKDIETKELNFSVAKNQMLPDLNFQFSYWSPGISGDRLLYLDDNPFTGVVIGTEEGSYFDSLSDAFKFLYRNWSVGLTLTIPVSNFISRAAYAQARLELDKSLLELDETRKQVFLEVRDSVREIETNAKRVEAYRLASRLAERRLQAEEKKLEVGLTTNYFVLQFQEELANARSQEIKALVDYYLSWAKLERATGMSLEKRNIKIMND
jgi:outer membrane protein TolC